WDNDSIINELGLPLFVKPNASGSSFGVSKVTAKEELTKAIELAFTESDEVLIEECITGREMGCGVMICGGKEYLFPITEIIAKRDFFDYEAKYTAGLSDEITPADITPEIKQKLNRMTLEAYRRCRCSGVVRIDFIVTEAGDPYLIEVNSIPGMSGGSIVPKQAREMGISLGELYDIIIEDTCKR
ncbi:MAG: ATP-grasp domain-containing protein, partial [Alistipes sp.]|nr:ATP-grasp domain-containing protein [Alistipes sp.]